MVVLGDALKELLYFRSILPHCHYGAEVQLLLGGQSFKKSTHPWPHCRQLRAYLGVGGLGNRSLKDFSSYHNMYPGLRSINLVGHTEREAGGGNMM